MAYWLLKSEPGSWSWDDQVRDSVTEWDGVRNHQANNNMKAMKRGDRCFFYHSVNAKEIVGVVEVVKEHYPDPTDASGRFGMVDVKAVVPVSQPVSLKQIKEDPALQDMQLVRQSRLSVSPVSEAEWRRICTLGRHRGLTRRLKGTPAQAFCLRAARAIRSSACQQIASGAPPETLQSRSARVSRPSARAARALGQRAMS